MPPKVKKIETSKKTDQKKKEKVIEDRTFGLKNKKGTKQQKFIKNVVQQVKCGNQSARKIDELNKDKLDKKEDKKKQADELNKLFRPVQTVGKGVDPKSVVCAFFKLGQCSKGDKCKFSHDLTLERKSEKRSMYNDAKDDCMDDWDESKLEDVVNTKHGEKNNKLPATAIICRYFLTALEGNKYGWFWECPNGEKCHYIHALPPGFVLKRDKKKEEKKDQISLEELIERERAALGVELTRITLETFLQWKERKRKEKEIDHFDTTEKKKNEFKQGKMLGISGREMFEFNPEMVVGDDDEEEMQYEREDDEDEDGSGHVYEISLETLSSMAQECDGSGTVRTVRQKQEDDAGKLSEAAAIPAKSASELTDEAISAAMAVTVNGDILAGDVPIDENLFTGDDLDDLDDDLETFNLDD